MYKRQELSSNVNEEKIKYESNFNELNKGLHINDVKLENKFNELRNDIKGLKNDMKEQNEKWERDRNQVNENKESKLNHIMNKNVSE